MNLQEKLQAIANHYGMDLQAIKLAEEGAELAAATLKNFGLMICLLYTSDAADE